MNEETNKQKRIFCLNDSTHTCTGRYFKRDLNKLCYPWFSRTLSTALTLYVAATHIYMHFFFLSLSLSISHDCSAQLCWYIPNPRRFLKWISFKKCDQRQFHIQFKIVAKFSLWLCCKLLGCGTRYILFCFCSRGQLFCRWLQFCLIEQLVMLMGLFLPVSDRWCATIV